MHRTRFADRRQSSTLKYHIGLLIAVTAWGAAFISTKILLQHGLSAVQIYVYRFVVAYVCTLFICPRPMFSNSLRDELKFLLVGICGSSVYFIAENSACEYTLVTNVALITATAPIITTIMVTVTFKTERISRMMVLGSLVAFLGVGLVIFNTSIELKLNPLGDMLALVSAVCWAIYTVLLKPLNATYSGWFISRKTFFYGVITALPFLAIEEGKAPLSELTNTDVLVNLSLLALVASMLSFQLWAVGQKYVGPVKSQNYLYLSPLVTLLLSALILHEPISWIGCVGCALILGGVIVSDRAS